MSEARTTLVPCPFPHGAVEEEEEGSGPGLGERMGPTQQPSDCVPSRCELVVFSVLHCPAFLGICEARDVAVCCFFANLCFACAEP